MQISVTTEKKLKEIIARYPNPHSAVMSALYLVQEELGYVTDEGMLWIAEKLQMPPAAVKEIASFYTMYHKIPVGKYHIQLCRTLGCMIARSKSLLEKVKDRLGTKPHEITDDGVWSYEEVECLGSCGSGPAALINGTLFEKLTPEKLDYLMTRIEREQPDLSYSTVKESLGEGLIGIPKSEIMP